METARKFESMGICCIVYTDISRDGMEKGVNWEATAEMARSIRIPVVASGGVAGIEDIRRLLRYEGSGIQGVVVGKALYSGALKLSEAVRMTRSAVAGRKKGET